MLTTFQIHRSIFYLFIIESNLQMSSFVLLCQVVSAVNCAIRGWINVDSDIIACEACGSRLLFSTPSSWTQHQGKSFLTFIILLFLEVCSSILQKSLAISNPNYFFSFYIIFCACNIQLRKQQMYLA